MSDIIDDLAESTIRQALASGPRKPILCSLIRAASKMLAESHGHEFVARLHAELVRRHVHQDNSKGVRRS